MAVRVVGLFPSPVGKDTMRMLPLITHIRERVLGYNMPLAGVVQCSTESLDMLSKKASAESGRRV